MLANLTYQEYITAKCTNIKRKLEEILLPLNETIDYKEVLEEAMDNYIDMIYEMVLDIYHSANLYPEEYEIETSVQKIRNTQIKTKVQEIFFELELLQLVINNLTDTYATEREHSSLEDILNSISPEKKISITKLLKYYENLYQMPIKYIGSGETCTVFQVGDKIIKFGDMRKYSSIPFCLPIEEQIPYGENKYMYITDKVETGTISEQDTQNIYNALRNSGFVWLDAKPDNIGKLNGELKILDDIDIYTESDLLSIKGGTVLEYVSYSSQIAMQELNWLSSKDPNFDINSINKYYRNQSQQTQENIEIIKDEYKRQHRTYNYDQTSPECEMFISILRDTIASYSQELTVSNKVTK